jgi:hypothetical protein
VGACLPFHSVVATSEPLRHYLFFFFLPEWLVVPSSASSFYFALPLERSKIAPTMSSTEAWLVAMLRNSLVVRGLFDPSL